MTERIKMAGGVLIAVKKELEGVITEIGRKNGQIKISNQKLKTRIGTIYAPQESRASKKELERIYEDAQKQCEIAKLNEENIIIIGDLNAKIDFKKMIKSASVQQQDGSFDKKKQDVHY